MRLNEVSYSGAPAVDGYGEGFFRIGGVACPAPLMILPGGVADWNGLDDLSPLLSAVGAVDVLLIGTGPETTHIPDAVRDALESAGIGVEIMGSAQACRTYNVLLGEGRRVGLALLPI